MAPRHPCAGKGPRRGRCPNLVARGTSCCVDCLPYLKQQTRRYDVERDQTDQRKFLHSRTWRKIREIKLAQDPLCERHLRRYEDVPATMVHHRDGNELNNAEENHESLCNPCHEEEERKGRWGRNK